MSELSILTIFPLVEWRFPRHWIRCRGYIYGRLAGSSRGRIAHNPPQIPGKRSSDGKTVGLKRLKL
jgi:hypothetical protein